MTQNRPASKGSSATNPCSTRSSSSFATSKPEKPVPLRVARCSTTFLRLELLPERSTKCVEVLIVELTNLFLAWLDGTRHRRRPQGDDKSMSVRPRSSGEVAGIRRPLETD